MRQRPGVVVSIQSSGSAVWGSVAAVANARRIACFDSTFSALGSGETNSAVPLRARRSSHLEAKSQGSCGVIGAQFGARAGQKMRSERLRLLLGVLVLAVGLRFAFDLIIKPEDLFSIRPLEGVE